MNEVHLWKLQLKGHNRMIDKVLIMYVITLMSQGNSSDAITHRRMSMKSVIA